MLTFNPKPIKFSAPEKKNHSSQTIKCTINPKPLAIQKQQETKKDKTKHPNNTNAN